MFMEQESGFSLELKPLWPLLSFLHLRQILSCSGKQQFLRPGSSWAGGLLPGWGHPGASPPPASPPATLASSQSVGTVNPAAFRPQ